MEIKGSSTERGQPCKAKCLTLDSIESFSVSLRMSEAVTRVESNQSIKCTNSVGTLEEFGTS